MLKLSRNEKIGVTVLTLLQWASLLTVQTGSIGYLIGSAIGGLIFAFVIVKIFSGIVEFGRAITAAE